MQTEFWMDEIQFFHRAAGWLFRLAWLINSTPLKEREGNLAYPFCLHRKSKKHALHRLSGLNEAREHG